MIEVSDDREGARAVECSLQFTLQMPLQRLPRHCRTGAV